MGRPWIRRRRRGGNAPSPYFTRAWPSPHGACDGDAERAQADAIGCAVLPLLADGYILEVRDAADVRPGARVHADGAPSPSEIDHEEPAKWAPDSRRAATLLAFVLCHKPRCSPRTA